MKFLELLNQSNLIAAHRGVRSLAPENTLLALKMSLGRSDFIEIDVRLSKDRAVVVIHDDTLQRTTDINEIEKFNSFGLFRVCELTLDELRELDYSRSFYKDKKHKEPLLTLRDALAFIKNNGMPINIEIKDMSSCFSDKEVVEAVVKGIKESKAEDMVLISSFRHEYLKIVKGESHALLTAALVENNHPLKLLEYLKELRVSAYHFNDELADKQTIKMLRQEGFFVGIYTVNDAKRSKELFKMGVNYIFSDSLQKKR